MMSQVPEKVLAWLYGVLHEYHNPQRAYSDIARALASYPTLSPRTEIYTSENGSSALLVTLQGTIPALFRGTTYRFPIKLWIPASYPQEPPIVYVTPGKEMLIRPGQHVGPDGRVYHPYLKDWGAIIDHATVAELLAYIQQVFAKEPPVISRPQPTVNQDSRSQTVYPTQHSLQQSPYSRSDTSQHGTPRSQGAATLPPRPPKQQSPFDADGLPANGIRSPPVPAKPQHSDLVDRPPRNHAVDGPPLPPIPREQGHSVPGSQNAPHPSASPFAAGSRIITNQYEYDSRQYNDGRHATGSSYSQPQITRDSKTFMPPVSGFNGDRIPHNGVPPQQQQSPAQQYTQPHPSHYSGPQYQQPRQSNVGNNAAMANQHMDNHNHHVRSPTHFNSHGMPNQQIRQQAPPPRDLLSDPFDITLPVHAHNDANNAPPIPPNPEREHLLRALSMTLVEQAREKLMQNASRVTPLQAQYDALLNSQTRLAAEVRQLEQISQTIESNERILHRAIRECDQTIVSAKSKPLPPIDEILLPPTLVAQQLWNLLAEEAAIREAMYVLQKGVDNGRIGCEVFVKQMRTLGREAFLKMALARKCAQGMGLELR